MKLTTPLERQLLQALKWMIELNDTPCPYDKEATVSLCRQLVMKAEEELGNGN